MNLAILHKEVQDFIREQLDTDLSKVIFKGSPFPDVNIQELATQIAAKKKAKHKLPTWFACNGIYFPKPLHIEQTSSETTANYKTQLVSGDTLIDLTGGFGVDSYAFAKKFKEVTHCEMNTELSEIAEHNYQQLKVNNISIECTNGLAFLAENNKKFDCIYMDPSRRDDHKGKVFLLQDCSPDLQSNLELLFQFANSLLIKVSPLLDISNAISALKRVKEIHVVAVDNEVKELLFLLEKSFIGSVELHTVNITQQGETHFNGIYKKQGIASFSLPRTYLYEPNSAILKAGLFNKVSQELKVDKIHNNSHLYTSEKLIDFPGRAFKILEVLPYNKKALKKAIPTNKANITVRNFRESVMQIRKKTGLKDGGNQYLFFTTDINNKQLVLHCQKV